MIAPPGSTIDGLADFVSARSVLSPGALVPSLLELAGPVWLITVVNVGKVAAAFAIVIS